MVADAVTLDQQKEQRFPLTPPTRGPNIPTTASVCQHVKLIFPS